MSHPITYPLWFVRARRWIHHSPRHHATGPRPHEQRRTDARLASVLRLCAHQAVDRRYPR